MTLVETLTLLLAILSVVVSFLSLLRTTKLQTRVVRAEEAQARLAGRQLDALEATAARESKADVRISVERFSNAHRVVIQNVGPSTATDVNLLVTPPPGKESPIVASEMVEKLPIKSLLSGDEKSLIAAFAGGTGTHFDAKLSWTNADGSRQQRDDRVSI